MNRRIAAPIFALVMVSLLGGCSILGGGKDEKNPKTPVLGQRISVLSAETGAEIDPALAAVPVVVPEAQVNTGWQQPGGNAAKAMAHPALETALGSAWSANIAGSSKRARLASGPVVADGLVYVIDVKAQISAFDLKTGERRWQVTLSDKGGNKDALFGGGVSADGGKLYATNGLGDAASYDAKTGKLLWKVRPGGPLRGAPTVASGNIYVISQDNQIFALNAETGATVWHESGTLESAGVFGVAAPAVAQGTVVAGFSSGELTAYRYENGRAVWQDALSRTSISTAVAALADIDASPVIDQGRVYSVGQGGRMVAMELVTGQRLWELNVAGIETPWLAGEWLFLVTEDAEILCIARNSGKIRWITKLPRWKDSKKRKNAISWAGPILAGGRLILASTRGDLVNVAIADGRIGSSTRTGGTVYQAPIVAEKTLLVLTDEGKLIAYR